MTVINKIEFGDFQTPLELSCEIAAFLRESGETPDIIVEPTCGKGSFILAAIDTFPNAKDVYGFDINSQYVAELRNALRVRNAYNCHLQSKNFFQVDWAEFLNHIGKNLLVIGNPPWITNSALGVLGSKNLPQKTNFQRHNGFAAKTGKANFDISEWMLIRLTEALTKRPACIAMLCKSSTARKTLRHAWLNRLNIGRCSIHTIDAQRHFGVSVDACLLVIHTGLLEPTPTACVYSDLSFRRKVSTIGLAGKELVADIDEYLRLRDVEGIPYYTWRSGVKHDAASVMEFSRQGKFYVNGMDEECGLEARYLFPLLKSSDIANGRLTPVRYVLLTQRKPSDDTSIVKNSAPKTWQYLMKHSAILDRRRSIIYEKRPRFSVFGVGDYTFSPWKVAVSGLYKNCRFEIIGKHNGKPIVLDDTCYFIPCQSEEEAQFSWELLNSDICQRFLRSLIFFDAKRPITIDVLNRIDLKHVADRLKKENEAKKFLSAAASYENKQSLLVFDKRAEYRAKRSKMPRLSFRH
jgi:hypothetical protein